MNGADNASTTPIIDREDSIAKPKFAEKINRKILITHCILKAYAHRNLKIYLLGNALRTKEGTATSRTKEELRCNFDTM